MAELNISTPTAPKLRAKKEAADAANSVAAAGKKGAVKKAAAKGAPEGVGGQGRLI